MHHCTVTSATSVVTFCNYLDVLSERLGQGVTPRVTYITELALGLQLVPGGPFLSLLP